MNLKNKLSIGLIVIIILSLVILNYLSEPPPEQSKDAYDTIGAVSQGPLAKYVDQHISEDNITVSDKFPRLGDSISI